MTFGFIMLRHVNNDETNQYWMHGYDCIRKYHPECDIVIIDDNSNYDYITHKDTYKVTVINGEYPGRGELLPYYYYIKNKWFDVAIIIHDSVFIQTRIDANVEKYTLLWDFYHTYDQPDDEEIMIRQFNDPGLLRFYLDKTLWTGCFGGMSIITHDFITFVNQNYDISKLLNVVTTRHNRCSFERVIACLLKTCLLQKDNTPVLLGKIHHYGEWGIQFWERNNYAHLPLLKVWTGR